MHHSGDSTLFVHFLIVTVDFPATLIENKGRELLHLCKCYTEPEHFFNRRCVYMETPEFPPKPKCLGCVPTAQDSARLTPLSLYHTHQSFLCLLRQAQVLPMGWKLKDEKANRGVQIGEEVSQSSPT